MSTTEWLLVAMVIIIPLIVATGVTLWTLEQVLKRNKKYRREQEAAKERKKARASGSVDEPSTQQSESV